MLADQVTGPLDRWFGLVAAAGLVVPALLVWPFTSLSVALWTFVFSVGRVALLSHVTWSINSICHLVGSRPFRSKDQAANVAWLALFSFGESWHNTHHAFPRAARVGVDRFQVDVTGRLISVLERAGFVSQVHQPARHVLESRRR